MALISNFYFGNKSNHKMISLLWNPKHFVSSKGFIQKMEKMLWPQKYSKLLLHSPNRVIIVIKMIVIK